jgi:alpha-galactosidase
LIVVVGWAGQWASSFRGLEDGAVHVAAGQELTHFKLLPGEEVRTPLSVLMFYRGDVVRSQNLWRRWMLAHNLPRPGGRLPEPILPAYTGRYFAEMALATCRIFFSRAVASVATSSHTRATASRGPRRLRDRPPGRQPR